MYNRVLSLPADECCDVLFDSAINDVGFVNYKGLRQACIVAGVNFGARADLSYPVDVPFAMTRWCNSMKKTMLSYSRCGLPTGDCYTKQAIPYEIMQAAPSLEFVRLSDMSSDSCESGDL